MATDALCFSCTQLTRARVLKVHESTHRWQKYLPIEDDEVESPTTPGTRRRKLPRRRRLPSTSSLFQTIKRETDEEWSWHDVSGEPMLLAASEIRENASKGACHLCSIVAEAFTYSSSKKCWSRGDGDSHRIFVVPIFDYYAGSYPESESFNLKYYLLQVTDDSWEYCASIHLKAHRTQQNPQEQLGNDYTGGIRKSTLTQLRDWLEVCTTQHKKCSQLYGSLIRLPRRLVRVEADGAKLSLRIIQVPLDAARADFKYATLSHCWGPRPFCKLLKDNYRDWRMNVPFASLSRTFKEALAAANALGFAFVWIDALCIVQDDLEDWKIEAPKMKAIYEGALVNLAATSSADGDGGLFGAKSFPSSCTLRFENQGLANVKGRHTLSELPTGHVELYDRHIVSAPLNQRAWVFQEQQLSKRIIHFAKRQIWWQCEETTKMEALHEDSGPGRRHPSYLPSWHDWKEIVKTYSTRDLTFESDRLIALSGVAEAFGSQQGLPLHDYTAGTWLRQDPNQLMWTPGGPMRSSSMNTFAPSWSWASYPGAVVFLPPWSGSEYFFDIHDITDRGQMFWNSPCPIIVDAPVHEIVAADADSIEIKSVDGTRHGYKRHVEQSSKGQANATANYIDNEICMTATHAILLTRYLPGADWAEYTILMVKKLSQAIGKHQRVDAWRLREFEDRTLARSEMQDAFMADRIGAGRLHEGNLDDKSHYLRDLGSGRYRIALV